MSIYSNTKRDSLGSVISFRSMESDDDSEIVCEDWARVSDDGEGEEGINLCDRDGSSAIVAISSPNIDSSYSVLVPKSIYIQDNLTLFHAMCCIEDLHFSSLEVADQRGL